MDPEEFVAVSKTVDALLVPSFLCRNPWWLKPWTHLRVHFISFVLGRAAAPIFTFLELGLLSRQHHVSTVQVLPE